MPLINETNRLRIQTWEPEDIEKLCHLTKLEGISEFSISGYSNFTWQQAKQWIEKEQERYAKNKLGKFAIYVKQLETKPNAAFAADDTLIGISGLFQMPPPTDNSVELNYRYPKQFRGKGYALEAAQALIDYGFNKLNLKEIYANADLTNIPSQKILTRLKMERVGDITYEGIKAGRWCIKRGNP